MPFRACYTFLCLKVRDTKVRKLILNKKNMAKIKNKNPDNLLWWETGDVETY